MCIVLCPGGDNIMPHRIHIIAYWFPFCQQSYKFPPIMESSLQRSLEIPTGLSAAVAEHSEQVCAVKHGSALCLIMHSPEITNTKHVCFLFLCVCVCAFYKRHGHLRYEDFNFAFNSEEDCRFEQLLFTQPKSCRCLFWGNKWKEWIVTYLYFHSGIANFRSGLS